MGKSEMKNTREYMARQERILAYTILESNIFQD